MTNGTSLKYWPVKGALCWIIGFVMSDHFCSLYQQHIHEALKRMWSMALQILNSIRALEDHLRYWSVEIAFQSLLISFPEEINLYVVTSNSIILPFYRQVDGIVSSALNTQSQEVALSYA